MPKSDDQIIYNVSPAEPALGIKSAYCGTRMLGPQGHARFIFAPLGPQEPVAPPPDPWTDFVDPWAQPSPPRGIVEYEAFGAFGKGGKGGGKGKVEPSLLTES